jgi:hypothetical protein
MVKTNGVRGIIKMDNNIKNIALITYTNSICKDVWPMYFGQLDKHAPWLKSYVFSNVDPGYKNHEFVQYHINDPYYIQWTNCLNNVNENYVIYAQEDFVLYNDILKSKFDNFVDFLENSEFDYIRPIRCGFDNSLNHLCENYYEVNPNTDDAFMMQISLWKKSRIRDVYLTAKSEKWLEGKHWRDAARTLGIQGLFTYNNEPKRGAYHYDSLDYPYICTAIGRGKWNVSQYRNILMPLFKEYNTNYMARGIK